MDPDHEDRFDFDPLDVTKTWPDDILPLQPVGRLVLNKNTDNFFNENEQLAFCPSIVVPGVYYSDEKMLQTRIFIYSDTLRYRLGLNYCNFLLMLQSVLITAITMMALSILCTGMRRSATSVQGMIKFAMLRCILFLQQSAVVNERSVSFRNRTILSKQEKGTPQFISPKSHLLHSVFFSFTGKDTLFVGGWRPSLILVSLLKYATLGSHSGLRFDHRTGLGGSH